MRVRERLERGGVAVFKSLTDDRPSMWRRMALRLWASATGVDHWRAGDEGLAVAFALTVGMCGMGILFDLVFSRLPRRWWRPLYSITFAWIVQNYYHHRAWWSSSYWDGSTVVVLAMWFMGEADTRWVLILIPIVVSMTSSTDFAVTFLVGWIFHPTSDFLRSSIFVPPCGIFLALLAILCWAGAMAQLYRWVGQTEREWAHEGMMQFGQGGPPLTTVPYTFALCRRWFDHKYLTTRPYSALICSTAIFALPTLVLAQLRQDVHRSRRFDT